MTGSEKIVARISEEAAQERERLLADARRKADEITAAAKADAEKRSADIAIESDKAAAHILTAARSADELYERNALLARRREEIEKTLEQAVAELCAAPADEYFAVIGALIEKNALNRDGVIAFSAADAARLPDDIRAAAKKHALEICDDADVDGGFILRYDEIEINCGFSAMLEEKRDALEDLVNRQLF